MPCCETLVALLAQATPIPPWEALRDSMRKEDAASAGSTQSFVIIMLGIMMIGVAIWVVSRLAQRKEKPVGAQARQLFRQAMKTLHIGLAGRILLMRIGRRSGLKQPTVMLLTPQLLERYAGHWADRFPIWSLRPFFRARVERIALHVFGEAGRLKASPATRT